MWDAIENKLDGADFFFGEMGRDLIPPYVGNPTMTAIAVSTGAVVVSFVVSSVQLSTCPR